LFQGRRERGNTVSMTIPLPLLPPQRPSGDREISAFVGNRPKAVVDVADGFKLWQKLLQARVTVSKKMAAKRLSYREGDVFAYPIQETGKFGIGLIGRTAPRGRIIKIYLFDLSFGAIPKMSDLPVLTRKNLVRYMRAGDLHLLDERWTVLGRLPTWKREDWSDSVYWRQELYTGRDFLTSYDEDNPSDLLEKRLVDFVPNSIPEDGLAGAGFVEAVMEAYFKDRQRNH
jgi:hypothetical protein